MSKKQKISRPKARLPKGLIDTGAGELRAVEAMLGKIRAVYERYGFEPLETPAFEYTDALGKFLPDQDRPNEGVFSFQDEDEQWLSLRYDLTAPLARYVAENFQNLPKPFRRYQVGPVWRNEKPGPGRFRQFMQFDADTVGAASVAADAEMCMLAADTLEALGFEKGQYIIKVNSRKVLDGLLETIGVSSVGDDARRLAIMRALDKFDRLGEVGVRQLLGSGRKDESGDFTKGAGLDEAAIEIAMSVFEQVEDTQEKIAQIDIRLRDSKIGQQGREELEEIARLTSAAGYGPDRIRIDPSVVRGLEYYTGPVFEAELTFEVKSAEGGRFGSVGGGGRYDGLVQRFTGQPVPATGFSIGVSRLAAALQALGKLDTGAAAGPVVVTVFNKDSTAESQRLVTMLRNPTDGGKPIRAEMYLGNPKNMGAQFKYADQRGSPCVVIQGPDEKAKGEVQIKDLIEGARAAATIESNEEWRESRQGQFAVKESELVEAVRKVLARYEE